MSMYTTTSAKGTKSGQYSANKYSPKNSSRKNARTAEMIIKIVSADYGPAGDKRLLTGELTNQESARIPFTRDVTPFLRALLVTRRQQQQQNYAIGQVKSDIRSIPSHTSLDSHADSSNDIGDSIIRVGEQKQNFIPVMDGKSMNAVFGDPCPGTSKRLRIHYIAYESHLTSHIRSEVFRVNFAEHERVLLRRRPNFTYQDDSNIKSALAGQNQHEGQNTLLRARKMGRVQSIAELADMLGHRKKKLQDNFQNSVGLTVETITGMIPLKWRLRSATSEIALPIILPFLQVKERVYCRLVCKVWRFVVQHWGVASTVDSNDQSIPNFSRAFLCGILSNSQNSLHSLFLCDFHELTKEDLHPAIAQLRKLRSLDISRCNQLDDSTMHLLAKHMFHTLEVLYMKGLRRVTDEGLIAVCHSCQKLEVLEISNIPITDEGATSIGENLPLLKALYMRDNFLVTNRSFDVITQKCNRLSQLTIWGCTKLKHLNFCIGSEMSSGSRLVLLNLWGCHSLSDEAANTLSGMFYLRSLIVSECHRLTNLFLRRIAQKVPNLYHLHLRYCKKMSDEGINAIANSLENLHSLDISFCSKVSLAAIINLMEVRHESLVELRLQHCSQLDIVRDRRRLDYHIYRREGVAGRSILNVLKAYGQRSNLSLLDLRSCGGNHPVHENYPDGDAFVQGMARLSFEQKLGGFFVRPPRWDLKIQQRLVDQVVSDDLVSEHMGDIGR